MKTIPLKEQVRRLQDSYAAIRYEKFNRYEGELLEKSTNINCHILAIITAVLIADHLAGFIYFVSLHWCK